MVNTILKEADLFCPNSVRINFTIYHIYCNFYRLHCFFAVLNVDCFFSNN
ncbi:ABC transporter ATP-binding protein [Lacticaseibacillus paracasei]|nr:ABC transporter ATP-binding protein [Lacticaseibacillus paracasei]MCT3344370.1 ABC transporter ATP-binding protein [Lacticaseibacillus paracasei]QHC80782.1 ABC transporter ATP-binding protein [Lacticaseibacillus paracasei]